MITHNWWFLVASVSPRTDVDGRLFGVTTLDVVRAARFVSELRNTDPEEENIPVIGGHSGATIVPLLSQSGHDFKGEERAALIKRIQFGGDEVVKAKDGAGSATLSMAWAGAKFADALLRAMGGESGVIIPTFVESDLYADKGCDFFASKVELGKEGVAKIHGLGEIKDWERELLEVCLKDLAANIKKVTPLSLLSFHVLGGWLIGRARISLQQILKVKVDLWSILFFSLCVSN